MSDKLLTKMNAVILKAVSENWPKLQVQTDATAFGAEETRLTTSGWVNYVFLEDCGASNANTIRYSYKFYHRTNEKSWRVTVWASYTDGETGMTAEYDNTYVESVRDMADEVVKMFPTVMARLGDSVARTEALLNL